RHVEVITPRLRLEPALPGRTSRAIGRDPVAEARVGAHEASAGALGVVPLVLPDAVDEQAHDRCSLLSPAIPVGAMRAKGEQRSGPGPLEVSRLAACDPG